MRRLAALLFAVVLPAYASPLELHFTFAIDRVVLEPLNPPASQPFQPGNNFHASLTVDDSILATDGRNAGKVTDFISRIGLSVWDQNRPNKFGPFSPSDFAGFRGPCTISDKIVGCFSPDLLLFDVLDHQVVGLFGGVFGGSDFPYIDFSGDRFNAVPHYAVNDFGLRVG